MNNKDLTKNEIIAISTALQFSIDNGLADDYEDTETLFEINKNFKLIVDAYNCTSKK